MSPWARYAITDGVALAADEITTSSRLADALRNVQVYALAALLIFGVLAFGTVENWAVFMMSAGGVALLMLWAVEQMICNRVELTGSRLFIPLAGFAVVIFVQYITRHSAYLYATRLSLLTAIMLGIICFVAAQILALRKPRERLTTVLAVFGFVLAVFAVAQHFTSPGNIYWMILPPDAGLVFGPYVNRNHFAGCMELLIPCALIGALDHHLPHGKRALFAFMTAVMACSVFISQSRAGSLSVVLELALFAVLMRGGKRRRTMIAALAGLLAVAIAMGLWLSGGRALERFGDVHDLRLHIARDTFHMLRTHPWLGWGAGTYEAVYAGFRSYTSAFTVDHAHNDYLEALAETGILGFSMVLAFVVTFYRQAWHILSRRSWSPTRPRTAALVGCTALLLHSFTDFNMHIPANAALFLVMAVMATSNSEVKYSGLRRQVYWDGK